MLVICALPYPMEPMVTKILMCEINADLMSKHTVYFMIISMCKVIIHY